VSGEPLAQLHGAATGGGGSPRWTCICSTPAGGTAEQRLADTIEQRSPGLTLARYGDFDTRVGAVLFDQSAPAARLRPEGKRVVFAMQAFGTL